MYFNLIIIKKCSIQHLKSDSPSSHGHQAPIINPKNQQHSATKKGSHEWSMVNIHLTLNNAPFLSTSKVSSKDPPPTAALFFWGGLEKIQKQKQTKTHTTQRGEKNKKKTNTSTSLESLHGISPYLFLHPFGPPVFCAHLVASWQLCG